MFWGRDVGVMSGKLWRHKKKPMGRDAWDGHMDVCLPVLSPSYLVPPHVGEVENLAGADVAHQRNEAAGGRGGAVCVSVCA